MIAISLASFAIPLSLGVLFKYKRPEKADRLAFVLSRPFFLLCLLLIPALAMSQSTFVFYLLTWRHALSGFLVGESQAMSGSCHVYKSSKLMYLTLKITMHNTISFEL